MRSTLTKKTAVKAVPTKLTGISNAEKLRHFKDAIEKNLEVTLVPKVTAAIGYAYFWVTIEGPKGAYTFSLYINDEVEDNLKSLLDGNGIDTVVNDTQSRMIEESEGEWEQIVRSVYSKLANKCEIIDSQLPSGEKSEVDCFTFAKARILFPMKRVISIEDLI